MPQAKDEVPRRQAGEIEELFESLEADLSDDDEGDITEELGKSEHAGAGRAAKATATARAKRAWQSALHRHAENTVAGAERRRGRDADALPRSMHADIFDAACDVAVLSGGSPVMVSAAPTQLWRGRSSKL